jgi:hypothetical protein
VENSCGKLCGNCGKVLVFHSYFRVLEIPQAKVFPHITMQNSGEYP